MTEEAPAAPSDGVWDEVVDLVRQHFGVFATGAVFVWVVLGSRLQRWLGSVTRMRVFNYSMALLLLTTLYPVVFA